MVKHKLICPILVAIVSIAIAAPVFAVGEEAVDAENNGTERSIYKKFRHYVADFIYVRSSPEDSSLVGVEPEVVVPRNAKSTWYGLGYESRLGWNEGMNSGIGQAAVGS